MGGTTTAEARRILVWDVHRSWTASFVRGRHEYLLPAGDGRCGPDWPDRVREVPVAELRGTDVDLVVLQRPEDLALTTEWLGRRPGTDVPAVYVEHDTPRGDAPTTRHPVADRADIPLVHVTAFNDLMWDPGLAPTTVIEHGIPDPGYRYTGELDGAAVVVDEPVRRGRVMGTDLLPRFAEAIDLDVYGMGCDGLAERTAGTSHPVRVWGDMPTHRLHTAMARRRCYLHPIRWTSLGLSLIEAMHLGMPVVGLATTEAVEAVPPDAGVLSTDVTRLVSALREFAHEPAWARHLGKQARETALARYGLSRFLADWDRMIDEAIGN